MNYLFSFIYINSLLYSKLDNYNDFKDFSSPIFSGMLLLTRLSLISLLILYIILFKYHIAYTFNNYNISIDIKSLQCI